MGWLEGALRHRLSARAPSKITRQGLRPAAVLIPVVSGSEGYSLLLTRRASNLRRQPGDISFPGGAIDPSDPTPLAAALRECEEEVRLRPFHVDILGQMDERATVTGFRITPFVGGVAGPYPFQPNHEVAELLQVPLASLQQPGVCRVERRRLDSGKWGKIYHYLYQGYDIWGITGRLIKEFLDLVPGKAERFTRDREGPRKAREGN